MPADPLMEVQPSAVTFVTPTHEHPHPQIMYSVCILLLLLRPLTLFHVRAHTWWLCGDGDELWLPVIVALVAHSVLSVYSECVRPTGAQSGDQHPTTWKCKMQPSKVTISAACNTIPLIIMENTRLVSKPREIKSVDSVYIYQKKLEGFCPSVSHYANRTLLTGSRERT